MSENILAKLGRGVVSSYFKAPAGKAHAARAALLLRLRRKACHPRRARALPFCALRCARQGCATAARSAAVKRWGGAACFAQRGKKPRAPQRQTLHALLLALCRLLLSQSDRRLCMSYSVYKMLDDLFLLNSW
jgi:hypothetical protein